MYMYIRLRGLPRLLFGAVGCPKNDPKPCRDQLPKCPRPQTSALWKFSLGVRVSFRAVSNNVCFS